MQWNLLDNIGVSTTEAVTDSFVSHLLLAGCCYVILNNMRYYLPKKEKYMYLFLVSTVLGFLWLVALRAILYLLFRDDEAYLLFLRHSSTIRLVYAFLMLGCVATISLLWYTQQEQQRDEGYKKETEQLARDAELFKLRQQLQPHFLFNSLNSISALITSQPEKARDMIQQLSDFLRGTLKKEEHQWNSLQEELQYLHLYLDIEKVRFGYRLQTEISAEPETEECLVPALLLQPAVENAIKFGLYDTTGEVCISIKAYLDGNTLRVEIRNPFDSETSQPNKGTGFGLASIKRRLFLLFGRNDLMQVNAAGNFFTTTILIPQQ